MSHWSHWIYAGLGAFAMFPVRALWDWYIARWWKVFWITFKAGFKQSPAGKTFMDSFYAGRAKKDMEIVAQHPELKDTLQCEKCHGTGVSGKMYAGQGDIQAGDIVCDDCGGTGWA